MRQVHGRVEPFGNELQVRHPQEGDSGVVRKSHIKSVSPFGVDVEVLEGGTDTGTGRLSGRDQSETRTQCARNEEQLRRVLTCRRQG